MKSLIRRAKNTPRVQVRKGRIHWEPSKILRDCGFENQALGQITRENLDAADRLNIQADNHLEDRKAKRPTRTQNHAARTMAMLFSAYKQSREFKEKKESTQRHYRRHIKILEIDFGDEPIAAITPKAIKEWYFPIFEETPRDAHNIFRTLRLILSWGISENLCEYNPARDVRTTTPPPRHRIGTREELKAMIETADRMGRASIGTYAIAGITTMQRVGDILRLEKGHIKNGVVSIKQGKTGKSVRFTIHQDLANRLDLSTNFPISLITSETSGIRYKMFNFEYWWKRVRDEAAKSVPSVAGLDPSIEDEKYTGTLLAADLRRTGMVWAAQGGAHIPEICSVSGHEIQHGLKILETYLPRDQLLADRALARLDIVNEPNLVDLAKITIDQLK